MIRKERRKEVNVQVWTFLLLFIILGCAGEGGTDPKIFDSEVVSYAGIWEIDQYISGCSEYPHDSHIPYVIEIIDNGETFSIEPIGTAHQALEYTCVIESERLVCTGFVVDRNNTRFEYPEYILFFDGQNHSRLEGTADWTAYLEDGDDELCSGTSQIIADRVEENDTPDSQP